MKKYLNKIITNTVLPLYSTNTIISAKHAEALRIEITNTAKNFITKLKE